MKSWIRAKGRELWSIDRRSLAFFRIGLGIVLLSDLVKRAQSFTEHYTSQGVFPNELARKLEPDTWFVRLYLLNDASWYPALLFGIAGLLALLLIVGYRTRLVTALSLLMLVSLVRRNPYVTHTGDLWLQAMTLWALFLPLGSYFSVDRLRSRTKSRLPMQVLSVGTVGVLSQVALFYLLAGLLKHQYDVWKEGDALWVFTNVETYTRSVGHWLKEYRTVLTFITYFTLILEMGAPLPLFCPWLTPQIRTLTVLVFACFHIGIQVTVYIGTFQVLSIFAVALFLPPWFWDRLALRMPAFLRRAYAGLRERVLRRYPGHANQAEPGPAPLHSRVVHALAEVTAGFMLLLIVFTNYNTYKGNTYTIPKPIDDTLRPLALIQNWNMFSDIGNTFFGWFLAVGQLEDGRMVDILHDEDFTGVHKPERFAAYYDNHNQRRFWRSISRDDTKWLRPHLARFLARNYNEAHDVDLFNVAMFYVGNVPGRDPKAEVQTLRHLFSGEIRRPGSTTGSPEERARTLNLREDWRRFLASLPREIR